ncbi:hypothetical protein [Lentibacillus sp.]|uniref:hypothetical protein n=1 Tax=Lentibacillus sp. TaxID=1925746 RepID=UPI002B4B78C2|nr:hypothetical protein [Lentibacillus sp.]HLS07973.1 hypothetical protein [Lentibacillus sp.]
MDKEQQEHKRFLEQQLQWCEEQDRILEEIENRLHKMKRLAEYSLEYELISAEIEDLNGHMSELKQEVHYLQRQLQSVVH